MSDKFKSIKKEFILSDSKVNCYGFRLLTSGYQKEMYACNPIGYYMHARPDGVVVQWENIRVDGDELKATPKINLSNSRGQQTVDEVEHGFLNAASVGHIVVLEYSLDEKDMLPGQTGPTVTKWFNRECSLVDIPGNYKALTELFDKDDNILNLSDFTNNKILNMHKVELQITKDLADKLGLGEKPSAVEFQASVSNLLSERDTLKESNKTLTKEKTDLQKKYDELSASASESEVAEILTTGLAAGKFTKEVHDQLKADYAGKPKELKALVDAMQPYKGIQETIKKEGGQLSDEQKGWTYDDYQEKDPSGKKFESLKANHPDHFAKVMKDRFPDWKPE